MIQHRYSNIVSQLLTKIPEFTESEREWNLDLPYDVFGSFALFLCKQINQGATEDLLNRAFSLLNEMALSEDKDVANLLVVAVLEVLADDDKCKSVSANYFSPECRSLLERVASGWD